MGSASVAALAMPAPIVTAKHPRRGRFGDVPDMTPGEHKRGGDAAVAWFNELLQRVERD